MKNAVILILACLVLVAGHPRAQTAPSPAPEPPSEVKADFLRIIDRPRVPLDVHHRGVKAPYRNLITEKLDIASERRPDGSFERVPMLVVRPEGVEGRLPVVIVLHGTGGKKEGTWNWLEHLAHRGIMAVAIDGRYHGERDGGHADTSAYNNAIHHAFVANLGEHQAHPWFYDNCWDVMRTVDYLVSRPDVDAARIGLTGTSKGGIEAFLTAAVDDRIKVVVPALAMQSFRWGLNHDRWQGRANSVQAAHEAVARELKQPEVNREVCQALWAKVLPGIRDAFDGPSMVRLLAGRPTLFLNGDRDPNCPIEGAEVAFDAARAAFHEVGADDRLEVMIAKETGHTVTWDQHQAGIDWFVTWLHPTTPPSTARYLFRKQNFVGPVPAPTKADHPGPRRPIHPHPARRLARGPKSGPTPVAVAGPASAATAEVVPTR